MNVEKFSLGKIWDDGEEEAAHLQEKKKKRKNLINAVLESTIVCAAETEYVSYMLFLSYTWTTSLPRRQLLHQSIFHFPS